MYNEAISILGPMPEYGWIAGKRMPDRRIAGVALMLFGKGRLQIGNEFTLDDSW